MYTRFTIPHNGLITDDFPDGRQERVQFDKITARVSRLCYGLDPEHVDPVQITQKVISGVYGGVTTIQLDDLVCSDYLLLCCSKGSEVNIANTIPRLPRPPPT